LGKTIAILRSVSG